MTVYSVATIGYGGCGHQHKHPQSARNCLVNLAARHPGVTVLEILKWNRNSEVVERFTRKKRCTECGRQLVSSQAFEFGHAVSCAKRDK